MISKSQEWLEQFDIAVAFDRPGTDEVITHQGGQRCASDKCGDALVIELNKHGFKYATSTKGVFTDTKVYRGVIPECFNIGVGYDFQHTSQECLDYEHLMKLRTAALAIDWEALPVDRDPKAKEKWETAGAWGGDDSDMFGYWNKSQHRTWKGQKGAKPYTQPAPYTPPAPPKQPASIGAHRVPELTAMEELDGLTVEEIIQFAETDPDAAGKLIASLMSDLAAAEARVSVLNRLIGVRA